MTFGELSWIPNAALRITFLQLTWEDTSLFQIVACNTLFWNLVFTSTTTYWLLSSDHLSRWFSLRAPKFMSYWPSLLSQCLPWEVSIYSLLLEAWESGETIHLFLFCTIKCLKFSEMWVRDNTSMTITINSLLLKLEGKGKVLHVPQRRWWDLIW